MLEHWTENRVTVNGAQFFYRRNPAARSAGLPTLLLVHGFSDNGLCWLRAAHELEASYDIVLPDVRGHGRSERLRPGEALDNAADMAALIDVLGLGPVLAGGHSMGAEAAAQLGARFPERVRALLLEDPPWREPEPAAKASAQPPAANPFWDWLKSLPGASLDEIIAYGRAENPLWHEDEWLPWATAKRELDLNVLQQRQAPKKPHTWRETVSALRVPTLLVTADIDKGAIVSPELAREAASLNPLLRVAAIPGAGHSIRRENLTAYMEVVRGFLKSVE